MNTSAVAIFTRDELWLMRSVVRHEMLQQDTWKFPPADRDLSNKIAHALLFCEDGGQPDAALELCLGDTYVLDYNVPQDAKDASGKALGRAVLLKAYRVRVEIEEGRGLLDEPPAPTKGQVAEILASMDREVWPWQRRQRPQR